MLELLNQAIALLPTLLTPAQMHSWSSLDIDYHPPHVERLYRSHGPGRLYLHRIHPCPAGAALFHPHPWPCAVAVLAGRYEMGIGAGDPPHGAAPPVSARIIARAPMRYEMLERDAWHQVRPLDGPVLSVMLTGRPWQRTSPRPAKPLQPLTPTQRAKLVADFRTLLA